MSLTYDQLEADPQDDIASVCRGLIIASHRQISLTTTICDAQVIARPFKRFFNFGQPGAAALDPTTTVTQTKFDGTLSLLYHFDDQWMVATRSTPDADIPRYDGVTYAQCFWRLWADRDVADLDKSKTYVFEIVGPRNRHVVAHPDDELIMIGVIDTQTGAESDPSITAKRLGFKHASCNETPDAEALLSMMANVPACETEGFVLVDASYNRVKVKNPGFFVASSAQQLLDRSPRTALTAALSESSDDILASPMLTPRIRDAVSDLRSRVLRWCQASDDALRPCMSMPDRREIARFIANIKCELLRSGAFYIIDHKLTVAAWVRQRITAPCVSKRFMNLLLKVAGGYHI